MFKIKGALESAGLGSINIKYTNTQDLEEIRQLIDDSEVIIVSPGRFKETKRLNKEDKDIIKFIYNLDEGSVKALRSKILEINYKS